jgi:hypothetical protein
MLSGGALRSRRRKEHCIRRFASPARSEPKQPFADAARRRQGGSWKNHYNQA